MNNDDKLPKTLSTPSDVDGRHNGVPIMAPWECDETSPYHPLIASVYCGRGHADKATALRIASVMTERFNLFPEILDALVDTLKELLVCKVSAWVDSGVEASDALKIEEESPLFKRVSNIITNAHKA